MGQTTDSTRQHATASEEAEEYHMMHYEPYGVAKLYTNVKLVLPPGPVEDDDLVGVCTDGKVQCRDFDVDRLVHLVDGDDGFERDLAAASRVLQNCWRTAKGYLLRRQKRRKGIEDLDIGLAFNDDGEPYLTYTIKHGSETHKRLEERGWPVPSGKGPKGVRKTPTGKTRIPVDKVHPRSRPKGGQLH